jgi:hypothetical protein
MTAVNAAIGIAGLYPLAESGHASSDSGHALAVNSLLMHLIGISVWVGGLIALYAVFRAGNERTQVLVSRYSTLALLAFMAVGVSGLTSGFIRLYGPEDVFSPYGMLLIGKAGLLVLLGIFGARYRLGAISKISASASGFWRASGCGAANNGLSNWSWNCFGYHRTAREPQRICTSHTRGAIDWRPAASRADPQRLGHGLGHRHSVAIDRAGRHWPISVWRDEA